jgi:hypothetical protein
VFFSRQEIVHNGEAHWKQRRKLERKGDDFGIKLIDNRSGPKSMPACMMMGWDAMGKGRKEPGPL